jgi:hypothetical protein
MRTRRPSPASTHFAGASIAMDSFGAISVAIVSISSWVLVERASPDPSAGFW